VAAARVDLELDHAAVGEQQIDLVDEPAVVVVELDLDHAAAELALDRGQQRRQRQRRAALAGAARALLVGGPRRGGGQRKGQEQGGRLHRAAKHRRGRMNGP
jgi:hypothetical protein